VILSPPYVDWNVGGFGVIVSRMVADRQENHDMTAMLQPMLSNKIRALRVLNSVRGVGFRNVQDENSNGVGRFTSKAEEMKALVSLRAIVHASEGTETCRSLPQQGHQSTQRTGTRWTHQGRTVGVAGWVGALMIGSIDGA
jgi:hypothetical protein